MGLLDMFSGRKDRIQNIMMEMEQQRLQAELRAREEAATKLAEDRFKSQEAAMESQLSADNAETKRLRLDQSVQRLGGFTGYRSLLAGRRGGGGFGPRGMLDAA